MAKNREVAVASMPERRTELSVTKDQAGDVSIGDKLTVYVAGEVVSVRPDFGEKGKFVIEIKNPQYSEIQVNLADRAVKKLLGQAPGKRKA